MDTAKQQSSNALKARLEFPIWYRGFAKSYRAWASAPSDLKAPLLLSGAALAKAEVWLLDLPDRLSESERRYIVRSISQSTKGVGALTSAGRLTRNRIDWRRSSDLHLWQAGAMAALGLWFFAPEFVPFSVQDALDRSLNTPEVYARIKAAKAKGIKNLPLAAVTPDPVQGKSAALSPSQSLPDADDGARDAEPGRPAPEGASPEDKAPTGTRTASAPGPTEVAGETVKPPADSVPEQKQSADTPPTAAPATPQVGHGKAARLAELALERSAAGDGRTALLVALEAAEEALAGAPEATAVHSADATKAKAALFRAMATREQLAEPLPALDRRDGPAALLCEGARALIAATAGGSAAAWWTGSTAPGADLGRLVRHLDGASLDGACRRLLVTDDDHNAEIRPLGRGAPVLLAGHEGAILASAFSPDGRTVATASQDRTARLWDAVTGRERAVLATHELHVLGVAFSPDGRRLLTTSDDKTARIWDVATARQLVVLAGHQGAVARASWTADGRRVLTTSWDGYARVWEADTGKLVRIVGGERGGVASATVSPDGQRVATLANDSGVALWDADTGAFVGDVAAPAEGVHRLAFSPDSRWLATLTWSGAAVLRDGRRGTTLTALSGATDRVRALAFGAAGRTAVAVTEEGQRLTLPLFADLAEAATQARSIAPPCLTADERTLAGLDPQPPPWCTELPQRGAGLPD